MQRKFIYGFIALSFAISMELVLALHLITRGAEGEPASSQLVSTIDIPKRGKRAGQATEANRIEQGATGPESTGIDGALPEGTEYFEQGLPPGEGYPPADAGALLDEDHPLGSEPADSERTDWVSPHSVLGDANQNINPDSYQDAYPAPDDSYYNNNTDYWENYPPPEDNNAPQPTSVPPTATLASPTATLPLPTATVAQPTVTAGQPTATQAPTEQATSAPTLPPTPVPPQATQTQAPISPTVPPAEVTTGLVSVRASTSPNLDGNAGDPAWAGAQAVTVDTSGGANQSATRVTIQSMYDDENVYFLLTWADPSQSFLLNPWEKQADGSWKRLIGAENKGGDENEYYQDKLALLWPVNNSLPGFAPGNEAGRGCAAACHSAQEAPDKPLGLMGTGVQEQIADLWQLKSVMNAGQVDDGYLDGTPYSKDAPQAGLHNDPGQGGYHVNKTDDSSAPVYMPKDGGEKTGAPGYILDSEKEELAEGLFAPAERVPGIFKAPFEGDRGDIRAVWSYQDGAWTLEIARKRVTGSAYDVQFDDLEKSYFFALATFDNTQVRHAVQSGAVEFKFNK